MTAYNLPLANIWMKYARSYDTYLRYTSVHKEIRSTIAQIIKQETQKQSSIVDVCCGTGLFEEEFIGFDNYLIDAIDGVPNMINVAMRKQSIQPYTTFIQSDATNLRYSSMQEIPDEHYNFTVIINGLYAIDDDQKAREELVRVTKAGGLLFFAGPTPEADQAIYLTNISNEFKELGIYDDIKEHVDLVNECNKELFTNVEKLHFYFGEELASQLERDCSIEICHNNFWYNSGHFVVARKS